MNREEALEISQRGIRKLIYYTIERDSERASHNNQHFGLLVHELKQLFEAQKYLEENLK